MEKQKPFLKAIAMLVRRDIHSLEYDPVAQYHFHFVLTWFWFLSMIGLPFVPVLWGHTVAALVVQEISLWANFATHFGAMSAALAAKSAGQKPSHADMMRELRPPRVPPAEF